MPSALIQPDALRSLLVSNRVVACDASAPRPGETFDCRADFERRHLPGARFLDIDRLVDPDASLPHTIPSAPHFARHVASLGIGNDTTIVLYEQRGLFASPRAWWLFRLFGHDRVLVLDGGLEAWIEAGGVIETGPAPTPPEARFTPTLRPELLATLRELPPAPACIADGPDAPVSAPPIAPTILDARSRGRFEGTAPEPRPGVPSGHVPGSVGLPYTELLDPSGRILPPDALAALFAARTGIRGIARDPAPIVTTCGSGITACALALALFELGRPDVAVFDGSWAEYAASGLPIETGPARLDAAPKPTLQSTPQPTPRTAPRAGGAA